MTNRASVPTPRKDKRRGTWYFVFDSIHPKPDGARRQIRKRGFNTKEQAAEALAEAIDADRAGIPQGGDRPTLGAVLDAFVTAKTVQGRAPATIEQYRWAASIATDYFGVGAMADEVTSDALDAFYVSLLSDKSARSVEVVHKTVKAAYRHAVDRKRVRSNPATLATAPGESTDKKIKHWTPDQVGRFLAYVQHDRGSLPLGLIELMADTGARRGEVLGLAWNAVDLDAGTVAIRRQLTANPSAKTELAIRPLKRSRDKATVSLTAQTVDVLRRRRVEQNGDRLQVGAGWPDDADPVHGALVFTWPDGRAIHPDTLTRTIARLSERAGLPRLGAHGLRHSWATGALAARVPVEVVAARLGNSTRVVQEVYSHVIPADDAAAAEVVGDLFRRSV